VGGRVKCEVGFTPNPSQNFINSKNPVILAIFVWNNFCYREMMSDPVKELANVALKVHESADGVPSGQIRALYASGVSIELIARSLGVESDIVKTVVNADQLASCANGTVVFTPSELATAKTRVVQAITAGSEHISAKVAMWLIDKHTVSADTKMRIEKGIGANQAVAINIQNVMQQAAEQAKRHV